MGSVTGESDERPVHPVTEAAFKMDEFEVTVGQYAECVTAGDCTAADTWTLQRRRERTGKLPNQLRELVSSGRLLQVGWKAIANRSGMGIRGARNGWT